MLGKEDKEEFISTVLLRVIYLLNGRNEQSVLYPQTALLKMRRTGRSGAVMWTTGRFQLLSAVHNGAVAQVQHNQDSPVDEKYTKWQHSIRKSRRPRQLKKEEMPFQQIRTCSYNIFWPKCHPKVSGLWDFGFGSSLAHHVHSYKGVLNKGH